MKSKETLNDLRERIIHPEYFGYREILDELTIIEKDLETLEIINSKRFLLFSERKKLAKEYEDWCIKNNVLIADATNMVTWFLCIKLKEWLENDK